MGFSANDLSPITVAVQWAARITTISLEMVIPGFIGLWIDQYSGTGFLFAVIGFALGLVTGIWHLVQMAQRANRPKILPRPPGSSSTDDAHDA